MTMTTQELVQEKSRAFTKAYAEYTEQLAKKLPQLGDGFVSIAVGQDVYLSLTGFKVQMENGNLKTTLHCNSPVEAHYHLFMHPGTALVFAWNLEHWARECLFLGMSPDTVPSPAMQEKILQENPDAIKSPYSSNSSYDEVVAAMEREAETPIR
jgi:hypothetical protein